MARDILKCFNNNINKRKERSKMATNHSTTYFYDTKMDREYYILKTKAHNIKLVSFSKESGIDQTVKNIRDTSYYGMNASFFEPYNVKTDKNKHYFLYNIAYQDGKPLASTSLYGDAVQNQAGSSVITFNGTSLGYVSGVTDGSNASIPKASGTWAQGGRGLYLCDSGWLTKYNSEPGTGVPATNHADHRTAVLVNLYLNDVYLFFARTQSTTVAELRQGMMSYVGISDSTANNLSWRGLLTDGGKSSQLRGEGVNAYSSILPCAVPQIIALKDKT